VTPETSPSKGWRETAEDMGVEAGVAEDLEASVADLRGEGYDELAERMERAARKAQEVAGDG